MTANTATSTARKYSRIASSSGGSARDALFIGRGGILRWRLAAAQPWVSSGLSGHLYICVEKEYAANEGDHGQVAAVPLSLAPARRTGVRNG